MKKYKAPARAPEDALEWFGSKKLKPQFDHRDVYREEHAYAFVVAKVMEMDVLQTIYDRLNESLAKGGNFQQFKKEIVPELQKLGWWGQQEMTDPLDNKQRLVQLGSPKRLRKIYRVNMRTARAAGQWQRIERTRKSHPYLLYELGPSKEHREQHVRWAGIILPSTDLWWQTHYPPNGWGCKCRVRQVSKREYERLRSTGRYMTEAPAIVKRPIVNKRSGQIWQVPEGIDPGFDMNAGTARQAHIQKLITNKLNSGYPAIAAAAAKDLVNSPAFTYFLVKPTESYPVAALDADLKHQLNVRQNAVLLSADTMSQQRKQYPDLTDDEYRLLPNVLNQGAVISQGQEHGVFFQQDGQLYKAVVRATDDKENLTVTSFRQADSQELDQERKRGDLVRNAQ
ncbi:MAG: phage minor head protein [Pseudomonadota bacterium]